MSKIDPNQSMENFDYKSNSNKSKAEAAKKESQLEEKRVEKVVTGKVITKKKSGFSKFAGEFISEDAKNIKNYVIGDVLIPAFKKAISDIITDGIDIILYGGNGRSGSRRGPSDRVSYRSYYDDRGGRASDRLTTRYSSNSYSYDDIVLDSRGEAEEVLARMDELMDTYGLVRVADLKDLVGITGSYTDNKYGWTNIRNAEIVHVRDGWMIKMPRAVAID